MSKEYTDFINEANSRHPRMSFSPLYFNKFDNNERVNAERLVLTNCFYRDTLFVKYIPMLEHFNIKKELPEKQYKWCIKNLKNQPNFFVNEPEYLKKFNKLMEETKNEI